ncbi:MAG: hypothetical protein KC417_16835 [Myxococcales bacterium]|nr:hypothetical protein [Myxococcales bacterium]
MRHGAAVVGLLATALCVATGTAHADELLPAEKRPTVTASVEPAKGIHVGDAITLKLHVKARKGDDVQLPKGQSFAPFELLQADVKPAPPKGDSIEQTFELKLMAFEAGDLEIPAVRLRVLTHEGDLGFVETPPAAVHVASLIGNEPNAAPKPAPAPVRVIEDDYTLAYIGGALLGILLLIGLTLLGQRWWRSRRRAPLPAAPPRPPWDVALERLTSLQRNRASFFADGREVAWVDAVSDTLRAYLGARYGFEALESTTDEILAWTRKNAPRGMEIGEISTFLGECDLVKFAKAVPDEALAETVVDMALRIVMRTRPAMPSPVATPPNSEAA